RRARAYYDGEHDTMLANLKLDTAFGRRLRDLVDNLCEAVADAEADRLHIVGWNAEATVADRLEELEKRIRFGVLQAEAHNEATVAGDAYLLVWPDRAGKARIYPHDATQCRVIYDPEDPTTARSAI